MTLSEYTTFDALGLAELVRNKHVSASELAKLALEATQKVNPQVNAVIEFFEDRLEPTYQTNAAFSGVPMMLKDIGASETGRKQEMGSRLTQGMRASYTSHITQCFARAGLVNLGRTATPEFALSSTTESIANGQTKNPWDLTKIAGGSSGGAAAVVASGIVPVAHASDGAGSIRIPASCCGLVGLKPSRGRVSLAPDEADFLGFQVMFALSRSVRDTAALLDAASHPAPSDPFILVQSQQSFLSQLEQPLEPLRIAFTTTPWGGYAIDPEIKALTETTAGLLESMGHSVHETSPQFDYDTFVTASSTGWAFGFDHWLDSLAEQTGREVKGNLEPLTQTLYDYAKTLTADDILKAYGVYNSLRQTSGAFFQDYDLLLTPTLIQKPDPLGRYSQSQDYPSFIDFFKTCDESCVFLPLFNHTGQPALSLPLHQSSDGLPIGMQFVARFGREDVLLRLGAILEQALPWKNRIPAVHASSSK
jgi:amidase